MQQSLRSTSLDLLDEIMHHELQMTRGLNPSYHSIEVSSELLAAAFLSVFGGVM